MTVYVEDVNTKSQVEDVRVKPQDSPVLKESNVDSLTHHFEITKSSENEASTKVVNEDLLLTENNKIENTVSDRTTQSPVPTNLEISH